jgi:hypothetical protein
MPVISVFLTGAATFSFKYLLSCTHEAEWTPFQTHHISENLVAPGIELWPLDQKGGHRTAMWRMQVASQPLNIQQAMNRHEKWKCSSVYIAASPSCSTVAAGT